MVILCAAVYDGQNECLFPTSSKITGRILIILFRKVHQDEESNLSWIELLGIHSNTCNNLTAC